MYWNGTAGDDFIALNGLTLTWDVLKLHLRMIEIHLTHD